MSARLRVAGEVTVPGDKSLSHRALMLAALATGESRLRGVAASDDVQSTARVLEALGVGIRAVGGELRIAGLGLRGLRGARADLDCGNSGTTARLMAGILAGQSFTSTLTGDESLSRRPMARVAEPLRLMGATVEFTVGGDHLPMRVRGGALHGISFQPAAASAQVKSAVLLAAAVSGVAARIREPLPTRDHTERLLRAMGGRVTCDSGGVGIEPVPSLMPLEFDVPGDPSSAAYFLALAVLAHQGEITLRNVSLNPLRTGFLSLLRAMGADVRQSPDAPAVEPRGTIVARPAGTLRAVVVKREDVPGVIDELPLLACLAARAEGETIIQGASELRLKESDRIGAVVSNLQRLGVEANELDDGMRIVGSDRPLAGKIQTHDDHRIAMSFGVLACFPGNEIVMDNPACVSISYPAFWSDLERACESRLA